MSVRAITKVWDGHPGGGSELLLMLALADWSDDDGNCWPAMEKIAKKTRLSRSQAQRVIHRLIAEGFVLVTGNEFGGPPGASRQYKINFSRLTGDILKAMSGPHRALDGSHPGSKGVAPRKQTGRAHATQTVIEPSENRQEKPIAQGATLPDWLPLESWKNFLGNAEALGKPFTPFGQAKAIAELEKLRKAGNDPQAVIEQTILSGGRILLPVNDFTPGRPAIPTAAPSTERIHP